jgi:hypothetical protein
MHVWVWLLLVSILLPVSGVPIINAILSIIAIFQKQDIIELSGVREAAGKIQPD